MRLVLLLALLLMPAAAQAKQAPAPAYRDLTRDFAKFHDETVGQDEKARVAAFRQHFAPLMPGFYQPMDGQTDAQFDASIAHALATFPEIRANYEQAQKDFPAALAAGQRHFRKQFPDFRMRLPVWLVHSLGRMDGGTRTVGGKEAMVFGADVIAQIHDSRDIGPFLDHELYHVANRRWFKDCDAIWCALWQEGSATYAASVMNPDADDHLLLLDRPGPIRAEVDKHLRVALCQVRADLQDTNQQTYAGYFLGTGAPKQKFPPRWGYYVGYRIVQRLGQSMSLGQIERTGNRQARPLLVRTLNTMIRETGRGRC